MSDESANGVGAFLLTVSLTCGPELEPPFPYEASHTKRGNAQRVELKPTDEDAAMDRLMIGFFHEQEQAEVATTELLHAGFARESISVFYVNPQGHHALHPMGGDEDESPGTHEAHLGAAAGAVTGGGAGAILGALTLPVLGPAGPLLGAAVGAYGGSLVGALNRMEEPDVADAEGADIESDESAAPEPRKAGILVAVAVKSATQEEDALDVLRTHAEEVEEATGELRDGDWVDFDPLRPKKLIFDDASHPRP